MRSALFRVSAGAVCLVAAVVVAGVTDRAGASPAVYDPSEVARAAGRVAANPWATIPPQCWTETTPDANPCWHCHAPALPPNELADWHLQETITFPAAVTANPWTNLFEDRSAEVAAITDAEALAWVRGDNYAALRRALAESPLTESPLTASPVTVSQAVASPRGWVPDLDLAAGFDDDGFARDGSGWRALRYKPFPGAFWPTNGSTDDVFIRLPAAFRSDAAGKPSRDVYRANLAVLEAAIASDPLRADRAVDHEIETLNETAAGADLDGDGRLAAASRVAALPSKYLGGAAAVAVRRRVYPVGTEFLHSVRYVDPDAPGLMSVRMKELRHSVKEFELDAARTALLYESLAGEEAEEAASAGEPPPEFEGDALTGLRNRFGWRFHAYIEDAEGRLRVQTYEEHLFCMGCHTTIGGTVDQTFAFPRKLPGRGGWALQDLRGQHDAPQHGQSEGEILTWVRRAGGGDEFRANAEFTARFLPGGVLAETELRRAAPGGDRDLAWLLAPSRERALELAKAYLVLVRRQSFALGRDPTTKPPDHVLRAPPPPGTENRPRVFRDGRTLLSWARFGQMEKQSGNPVK